MTIQKMRIVMEKTRHPFWVQFKKNNEKEIEHVDNATATIELKRRCAQHKKTLWQQKNGAIGLFLSFETVE